MSLTWWRGDRKTRGNSENFWSPRMQTVEPALQERRLGRF